MTSLRVSDRVGVTEEEGVVFVARLPDGPILELGGTAALVWRRAFDGPREQIADRVSQDAGTDPAEIRDEVNSFVETLIELGLLVTAGRQ